MEADFRGMVERDLWGRASEAEQDELERYADDWRAELVRAINELDAQLAERRAQVVPPNNTPERVHAYDVWKKTALGRKKVLISRLADVKSVIKARNVDEHTTLEELLGQLLSETRRVRELLEAKL